MLGCLRELDAALRERGARLFVRRGRPEDELPRLAREVGASAVHLTADVSPWARARDARVTDALRGVGARSTPPPAAASSTTRRRSARSRAGPTRSSPPSPARGCAPSGAPGPRAGRADAPARPAAGDLPARPTSAWTPPTCSDPAVEPGEPPGARRLAGFLRSDLADLRGPAGPAGGRLVAPVPLPALGLRLAAGARQACRGACRRGARDYRDRAGLARLLRRGAHALPARDPRRVPGALPRPRVGPPPDELEAWKQGRTGFPLVDAGMRQLLAETGCTTACGWSSARS